MTPERLQEARLAHAGCEKPEMCLGCGLLGVVDRLREALERALECMEAHDRWSQECGQGFPMVSDLARAALSSGGAP